jgi:predicted  nucleic acid-binding Zn-ribbon protein
METLFSLLDEIHELKKKTFRWEHQNKLYLQSAIENAANELSHLKSHLEYLEAQEQSYPYTYFNQETVEKNGSNE